jgi:hypothetical protein
MNPVMQRNFRLPRAPVSATPPASARRQADFLKVAILLVGVA